MSTGSNSRGSFWVATISTAPLHTPHLHLRASMNGIRGLIFITVRFFTWRTRLPQHAARTLRRLPTCCCSTAPYTMPGTAFPFTGFNDLPGPTTAACHRFCLLPFGPYDSTCHTMPLYLPLPTRTYLPACPLPSAGGSAFYLPCYLPA